MHWMVLAVSAALLLGVSTAAAVDEPAHTRVWARDGLELRRYAAYVVAEVEVEGDFRRAGNLAFRPLFNFISGANVERRQIPMTAPVTQAPGRRIPMTAPVTQQPAGERGRYRVGFVMPAGMTLAETPLPTDPRITLREVPERSVLVWRYGGSWNAQRYAEAEASLLAGLESAGLEAVGDPVWARYDGPMTPWFMRRNEVMVDVAGAPSR